MCILAIEHEAGRLKPCKHVTTEKETGEEENDKADGDEREKYSRNQRDKKEHNVRPDRNLRLRSRELGASALRACVGVLRIALACSNSKFLVVFPKRQKLTSKV